MPDNVEPTKAAEPETMITLSESQLSEMKKSIQDKVTAELTPVIKSQIELGYVKERNNDNVMPPYISSKEELQGTSDGLEKMIANSVIAAFAAKEGDREGYTFKGIKGNIRETADKLFANDVMLSKAIMSTSSGADGGVLITPQTADFIIPFLHNQPSFFNDIPDYPMLGGSLTIPKELSAPLLSWNGDTEAGTVSTITYGDIKLNSKRVDIIVPVSNQLLRYTSPFRVQTEIEKAMRRAMIPGLESAILTGDGTQNHILGIYNTIPAANKINSAGTTDANIIDDLGRLRELVEQYNISVDGGAYVMSSRSRNRYMRTRTDLGVPIFAGMPNTLDGYKVYTTNTVKNIYNGALETGTSSRIYFFDPTTMIKGVSRNMTLEVHPYGTYVDATRATISGLQRDLTIITLRFEMDFAMPYIQAAAVLEAVA